MNLKDPTRLFLLISLAVGIVVIVINPPLRGPDESAHFVRIYSIGAGEIVPGIPDTLGRRGVMLPSNLHWEFSFFEIARAQQAISGKGVQALFQDFNREREAAKSAASNAPDLLHQPYGGSEAYSPASYLPYLAIAVIGQQLSFDFLSSLYAMRLCGLLILVVLTAYAIAIVPNLKWAFFSIAMLPSVLYSRSVLTADGMAVTATLVLTAVCLRATGDQAQKPTALRSLWMSICVLTKPAQTAFLLLEGMTNSVSGHVRHKAHLALVILPGFCLTLLWLIAGSADVGSWRLMEEGQSGAQYNLSWKLRFMLEHPLHFPKVLWTSLDHSFELGRQLIGVLGWLDTPLRTPVYPALAILVLLSFLNPLDNRRPTRRIAFWAIASMLAYAMAIFLIFFLAFTPTHSDRILGVQGRYFVVVLPCFALLIASLMHQSFHTALHKWSAVAIAAIGSVAVIDAIITVNW